MAVTMRTILATGLTLAVCSLLLRAQNGGRALLQDQPLVITTAEQFARLNQQVAPFVSQARKTWPDVRARFQAGLPEGNTLFVTVNLRDVENRSEIVFVEAIAVDADRIRGVLANDIGLVRGYAKGDRLTVNERSILDWTITKPDGSEEGNVVGSSWIRCRDSNRNRRDQVAEPSFVNPQSSMPRTSERAALRREPPFLNQGRSS